MDVKLIDLIEIWLEGKSHLSNWRVFRDGSPSEPAVMTTVQNNANSLIFAASGNTRIQILANGTWIFGEPLYDRLDNGTIRIPIYNDYVLSPTSISKPSLSSLWSISNVLKDSRLYASDPMFFEKLEEITLTSAICMKGSM